MSETMQVACPKCLNRKTILKTNKNFQVRCSIRDSGCGNKYYTNKNIVLSSKTVNKPYNSRWDPSNLSILRTFYYFLTGKNHRGEKVDLIELLILELGTL